MPVCSLNLLSLNVPTRDFVSAVSVLHPLVVAKVVRWIVTPKTTSKETLIDQNIKWHLLVVLPPGIDFSDSLISRVEARWTVQCGIPSRTVEGFHECNHELLRKSKDNPPPLVQEPKKATGSSSEGNLELSPALERWIDDFAQREGRGPVSMLNLLAFNPGRRDTYIKYGAEFSRRVGSKHGGDAKVTGLVVSGQNGETEKWDQMALAQYPSIRHFGGMLASEDYQDVNRSLRLPALRDTFILCTKEVEAFPKL